MASDDALDADTVPEPGSAVASHAPDVSPASAGLGEIHGRAQARELSVLAETAFGRGDYRRVVELDREIAGLAPDTELAAEAEAQRRQLRPDPVALYSGLFAVLVYAVFAIIALW
jgi:hypothetical protein